MTAAESILASVVMLAATYLLAGLGSVFSARAGVVNIAIEGMMLSGCLLSVVGSWLTGSVWMGLLFAMAGCALLSLLFAFFTVVLHANQTVTGVAFNILATGFTTLLFRTVFDLDGAIPQIDTFSPLSIPLLSEIPFLGALFRQIPLVYIAFLLVPPAIFLMNRTNLGLVVRSVGNHPKACDTVGLSVSRVRILAILAEGLMTGMAGAFLATGRLSFFTEGMVAGRGYMVNAAVVFGNYTPAGVLLASLVFGASETLQYRLQTANTGIPTEIWGMLPYVITLLTVCVFRSRSNRPVYSGQNYIR